MGRPGRMASALLAAALGASGLACNDLENRLKTCRDFRVDLVNALPSEGAVHIAQALAPIAVIGGYAVTIIDPRRSFATAERFPGVTLTHEWPDEAMDKLKLDARTAIVTLTHDPKIDDPALERALRSDCFYIGCLGSTRTHKARLARLAEQGFGEKDFVRLHGPIGLDIGAQSPAEIAISIVAEVTAVLRAEPEATAAAAA